ncbi:hypothetical protein BH10ACI4_BH10ACI4_32910 [soil metagenome]
MDAGGPRLSLLRSREIRHIDSVCADPQGWLMIEAKIELEAEGLEISWWMGVDACGYIGHTVAGPLARGVFPASVFPAVVPVQ